MMSITVLLLVDNSPFRRQQREESGYAALTRVMTQHGYILGHQSCVDISYLPKAQPSSDTMLRVK